MSFDEWIDYLCKRNEISHTQLRNDMAERGWRPGPCDCEFHSCKGWRFYFEEEFDTREQYLAFTREIRED